MCLIKYVSSMDVELYARGWFPCHINRGFNGRSPGLVLQTWNGAFCACVVCTRTSEDVGRKQSYKGTFTMPLCFAFDTLENTYKLFGSDVCHFSGLQYP